MADYLVLARKYRSATFDEVVGQEHVAATLVNAIEAGRVAHAFLFAGTRGVGKTTMARILAKALNCLKAKAPTATPCNECEACVAISRGDDVDVVEIDGASNRGIEEIRQLRSSAIYAPARCRYRIYYIDEVHMLTREAFNALLKTLEEPPPHVKFIFATTEPEKLPATVLSRCQRFDFRNIPTADIAAHLRGICRSEKVEADDDAIFRIARAACGSMRDGLSLLDQLLAAGSGRLTEADVVEVLGTPSDERTATIVSAIADNDPAAALGQLDELLAAGVTLESAVAAIGETFRNMMLACACGGDSPLIELPDVGRKVVVELAGKFTLPALVAAVATCQTTGRNLRGLASGRGLVEAALVRLASADKFVDAASLVERLESLTGGARPAGYARPAGGPQAQKKNTLAPPPAADAPPPVAASGAYQGRGQAQPAKPADLSWDFGYLSSNWPAVVSALLASRQGQISGLLAPAAVLGLEDDTLRLGFDAAHKAIHGRCEAMRGQIEAALGALFERQVRCLFEANGEAADANSTAATAAPAAPPRLSSSDRAGIMNDSNVKMALDFFGGSIADIRPAEPPAGGEEPADET